MVSFSLLGNQQNSTDPAKNRDSNATRSHVFPFSHLHRHGFLNNPVLLMKEKVLFFILWITQKPRSNILNYNGFVCSQIIHLYPQLLR